MSVLAIHFVLSLRAQLLFVVMAYNVKGHSLGKPVQEIVLAPIVDRCTLVKSDLQALTLCDKV